MAVNGRWAGMDEPMMAYSLGHMGITAPKEKNNSFFVASHEGQLYGLESEERLEFWNSTVKGEIDYGIVSVGEKVAPDGAPVLSSIKIYGEEYAPMRRGLNVVVFNNETRRVIDAVTITDENIIIR